MKWSLNIATQRCPWCLTHVVYALQLYKAMVEKPPGADAEDDAPLVDCGEAGNVFAHAANLVKDAKGAEAVAAHKGAMDVLALWPSWESKREEAAKRAGLEWLL